MKEAARVSAWIVVFFFALVGVYFVTAMWIPAEIAWHRQGCRASPAATGAEPSLPSACW